MQKILVCGIVFVLLSGCASGLQKMRKIDPGMSILEVDQIMGRRDSFRSAEYQGSTYTLYQWTNQYCNAHKSLYDKCDFFVIFKDGQVVETGVKDVRGPMPVMQYMFVFEN